MSLMKQADVLLMKQAEKMGEAGGGKALAGMRRRGGFEQHHKIHLSHLIRLIPDSHDPSDSPDTSDSPDPPVSPDSSDSPYNSPRWQGRHQKRR